VTDAMWREEQALRGCPIIAIGGQAVEAVAPGVKTTQRGDGGGASRWSVVRKGADTVLVWGIGAEDTSNALRAFLSDGLADFLEEIWREKSSTPAAPPQPAVAASTSDPDADPIGYVAAQIVDERHKGAGRQARATMIEEVALAILRAINEGMIAELDDAQVARFGFFLDSQPNDNQIVEFMLSCGVDAERVAMEATARVTEQYLRG